MEKYIYTITLYFCVPYIPLKKIHIYKILYAFDESTETEKINV